MERERSNLFSMTTPDAARYFIRDYRNKTGRNNLKNFTASINESDLFIRADTDLTQEALDSLYKVRAQLEGYIKIRREFLTSLKPIGFDIKAPHAAQEMLKASTAAGVGPFAAVAGAVAEAVGRDLMGLSRNLIIENGGDIWLNTENEVQVGIFAGESSLSNHLAITIKKEEMPLGICTSSATVGPSLSFGKTDACCVKARSAALADAAASSVGNLVQSSKDIAQALEKGMTINGVLGIVIIMGDHLGAIGDIELHKAD